MSPGRSCPLVNVTGVNLVGLMSQHCHIFVNYSLCLHEGSLGAGHAVGLTRVQRHAPTTTAPTEHVHCSKNPQGSAFHPFFHRNPGSGIPGWCSGLAPAFGPGHDPGDPGSSPMSGSRCMEPASPSACVSAPLSLSLSV